MCYTEKSCVTASVRWERWDPVRLDVPETLFGGLVVTSRDYVRAKGCGAQSATWGGHKSCVCHTADDV